MATTLNNIDLSLTANTEDMIIFTEVPNIITYTATDAGTRARLEITVDSYAALDNGTTFSINGNVFTSTDSYASAKGRTFYAGSTYSLVLPSIASALRNAPSIAGNYDISAEYTDTLMTKVIVQARTEGSQYTLSYTDNTGILLFANTAGTSPNPLKNSTNGRVSVELRYGGDYTYTEDDKEPLAVMTKAYYSGSVSFDISPVLMSIAEYGKLITISIDISIISDTGFSRVASADNIQVGYGFYLTSSGAPTDTAYRFIQHSVDNMPLLVTDRKRYITACSSLPVSTKGIAGASISYDFLDSGGNILSTGNLATESTVDTNIGFSDTSVFDSASTLRVFFADGSVAEWEIVKPLTSSDEHTRILWRGDYGGIETFDFTGNREESVSVSTETYEKGIYGYYDLTKRESTAVYANNTARSYTVSTHLIDGDGLRCLESLSKSHKVWLTDDDGNEYDIILEDLSYETTEFKDVYTATVRYRMSIDR